MTTMHPEITWNPPHFQYLMEYGTKVSEDHYSIEEGGRRVTYQLSPERPIYRRFLNPAENCTVLHREVVCVGVH